MIAPIKSLLKRVVRWDALPDENRESYRRFVRGRLPERVLLAIGSVLGLHMNVLARLARTDKYGTHKYTPIYQRHFQKFRRKRINLLEIGVGGYADERGGKSLDLWRVYFPRARIAAIDIYDKTYLSKGGSRSFSVRRRTSRVWREFATPITGLTSLSTMAATGTNIRSKPLAFCSTACATAVFM